MCKGSIVTQSQCAMGNNRKAGTPEQGDKSKREARLAAALRENLRKRKAQARARHQGGANSPESSGEQG